jgi:hypothetical protein
MKDAYNYKIKGNKPNCSGLQDSSKINGYNLKNKDVKPAGVSGIKGESI